MRNVSFALSMLLLLVLLPGASCGQPDVRTHAQIAKALEGPVAEINAVVYDTQKKELNAIYAKQLSPEDTAREIAALRAQWAQVDASMLGLNAAYDTYSKAITNAHRERTALPEQLAMAVLSQWQSLLAAAETIGLELPGVPGFLKEGAQ